MSSRRAPAAAACAATTPTFGRGLATTFLQCRHLLDLFDSGADPHLVGEPFDIWCQAHMLPWVLDHIHMDSDLVRRWQGGDVDVSQRLPSDLIWSAAAVEPRIGEPSQPYLAMRALPSCLDPVEPLARAVYESGWRPPHSPGPTREDLVDILQSALNGEGRAATFLRQGCDGRELESDGTAALGRRPHISPLVNRVRYRPAHHRGAGNARV